MRRALKISWYIVLSAVVAVSCQRQEESPASDEETVILPSGDEVQSSDVILNSIRIRVSEDMAGKLEQITDEDGIIRTTALKSGESELAAAGIISMERTFPYAGEFEKRTRTAGLHLWYDAQIKESAESLTKAANSLSGLSGVEEIEVRYKIAHPTYTVSVCSGESSLGPITPAGASTYPFDDPYLGEQWHYFNDGSRNASVAGCDINVFPVWKNYKKQSIADVVVSVVDGGIDYAHPDIHDNMWHNPEQSREEFQYGYNFVTKGYLITPYDHGTHVAGTIGAVNNNGIGCCGVAGGDAQKKIPGVKLMSCQIFENTEEGNANSAAAIKWGADHGAVISQNSWGYTGATSMPASDAAAIDYFNEYAGYDKNGNQVGPMAGGVVIFAAGNDDKNIAYPASYEGCLAVTSLGANFKRAYYSNFGSWTDITAPGGDYKKGNQIFSTLPSSQYGWMQGTSMACPHVSGVAALIISQCGGQGFTNTELKNRLLTQYTSIDGYNKGYELGVGLVNAYAAVNKKKSDPPSKVTDLSVSTASNNIRFSLTIPSDPDDGKPYGITVHYSTSSFTDPAQADAASFLVGDKNAGEKMEDVVRHLGFNTHYFVAATAYDMSGSRSELSSIKEVTTGSNHPPVIKALDSTEVTMRSFQTVTLRFVIDEPDGHDYTYFLDPEMDGVYTNHLKGDTVQITLDASMMDKTKRDIKQSLKFVAEDEYEMSSSSAISFTVLSNTPPYLKKEMPNLTFSSLGQVQTIDMSEYFGDDDGEQLKYKVSMDKPSVANFNQQDNMLYITAMSYGLASCTCTAVDNEEKTATTSFKVLVMNPDIEIELYPMPVIDVLNIRGASKMSADAKLYNTAGALVWSGTLVIDPFNPPSVDMSSMSGGVYKLVLKTDSKTIERTFVKL